MNKQILIGDFYGEVEKVIITSEEKYCIMAGCGVIVYSLRVPFTPYEYQKLNDQWKEWYRDGDIWVVDIVLENNKDLIIQLENRERKQINIENVKQ